MSKLDNLNAAVDAIDIKVRKLYHRRGEILDQISRCTKSTEEQSAKMQLRVEELRQYADDIPTPTTFEEALGTLSMGEMGTNTPTGVGQTMTASERLRKIRERRNNPDDPASFFDA